MCSHTVRLLADRLGIINIGAAEGHLRDRDEDRRFVDRIEQPFGGNFDPIICPYHVDARATRPLRFPEIHHGRKVQIRVNYFIALAAEVEAGSNHSLALGDVAVNGDRVRRRVHQLTDLIAYLQRQRPPMFLPRTYPARGPNPCIIVECVKSPTWHRSQ